ncbi:hypothetical protein C6502_08415 [Candidatus Poribacteria bacterium]|nr:MAG: hypothetical protein C6502_08415 [Candidatus Poribacteria bacterium]
MKQQKGFDWFKLATTAMFVTGIGLCLFSIFSWIVFRESLSTNTVKVNLDVPPVSSIEYKAQYLQNDPSSEWEGAIYQDTTTQEDTTQINKIPPQFEPLDSDLLSEFEEIVFDDIDQTDEFGQTPEELEQMAADVLQKLNEVVGEYRSIAAESADLLKMPPSPEIGKRWNNLKQGKIDLMPHVINLVQTYLLYTKDTVAFNPGGKIAEAIEGILEVELGTAPDGRPIMVSISPHF